MILYALMNEKRVIVKEMKLPKGTGRGTYLGQGLVVPGGGGEQ